MNLRVLFDLFLIIFCLYSTTYSFKIKHGMFSVRLTGGINASSWWGSEDKIVKDTNSYIKPYEYRRLIPGFTGGCSFAFRPVRYFALQQEILFAMKGFKTKKIEKNEVQVEIIKEIIRLHYLEFPFLVKLMIPMSNILYHLYTGPVYGRRVSMKSYKISTIDDEDYKEMVTKDILKEIEKEYKKNDFGLAMGFSFDVGSGTELFILDFRYTLGLFVITQLSDTMVQNGLTSSNIFHHRNNSFSLNIGFALIL